MTIAKDPDATIVLTLFIYNFITGELVNKENGKAIHGVWQKGYKNVVLNGRYIAQHRIAWLLMTGTWPCHEIDHVNRVRHCNAWHNLRDATRSQNCENRVVHLNNHLQIRGVRFRKQDSFYEPRLMKNGKSVYLGIYKDLQEAIAVRKKAEQEHFTHAK